MTELHHVPADGVIVPKPETVPQYRDAACVARELREAAQTYTRLLDELFSIQASNTQGIIHIQIEADRSHRIEHVSVKRTSTEEL